jgi:hypothetical protein
VGISKAAGEKGRIWIRNPVVRIRESGSVSKRHGTAKQSFRYAIPYAVNTWFSRNGFCSLSFRYIHYYRSPIPWVSCFRRVSPPPPSPPYFLWQSPLSLPDHLVHTFVTLTYKSPFRVARASQATLPPPPPTPSILIQNNLLACSSTANKVDFPPSKREKGMYQSCICILEL